MAKQSDTIEPIVGFKSHRFGLLDLLILSATSIYFLVFYAWGSMRLTRHVWIMLPDEVLLDWVGGSFSRFGILDRLPIVAAAVAILGVSFLLGSALVSLVRAADGLTRLENVLCSLGVGLNLLSLLTLLAGLFGRLPRGSLLIGLGALSPVLVFFWRTSWMKLWQPSEATRDNLGDATLARFCFGGCLLFGLFLLLGGFLPPWHFDVREYHLQVPKEWFQQGYIGFLPHNVYGNMPLGAEVLTILGMEMMPGELGWQWGGLVGKAIIASFAILAAAATYALGARFFSRSIGWLAAFVFLSTPWIPFVSMAGFNEGPSAFYLAMTVLTILLWSQESKAGGYGKLAVSGFMAGAAVSCKYPALLFTVVPAFALIVGLQVSRRSWDCKPLVVFSLAVFAGCGLWFGKNWVLTGNPTYPLLYELFDGETRTPEKHEQWTTAHRAPDNGFSFAQFRYSLSKLLLHSDYLSPLLVPFCLVGLLSSEHRKLALVLAAFAAFAACTWWLLTHRLDRFLLPQLPLVAILVGVGITRSDHPYWRRAVFSLVALAAVANFVLVVSRSAGDNRFLVALDDLLDVTVEELGEDNPHMHISHVALNRLVADGYRALLCGEAQVYDLTIPIEYNTCFDDCVTEKLLAGRTREQRLAALRKRRISHVLVNWHELDRYREPGNYGYSSFVTRDLVRRELVQEQNLLREIPLANPENSQLFEVVGWQSWTP